MYEIIGIEFRTYVSKKTGKEVSGYNLYLKYLPSPCPAGLEGVRCVSEWISPEIYHEVDLCVGANVDIFYNRYGRVEVIKRVD